jgi:uncharacterized protein YbbC (DUF1343 family)
MGDNSVRLGCEVLVDDPPAWLRSGRLGLLVNQASVSHNLEDTTALVRKAGGHVCCLFTPQHGFYAEKQANMIESADDWDASLDIPIFSLYGEVRQPTIEMLKRIDVLLIDLQDVGTRVYTYCATMGLCLEAAVHAGVKVVILDRPNPIDGLTVEGNIVGEEYRSFVGRYPIPMRHGLTMGELAEYIRRVCSLDCDLEVVAMKGWKRSDLFPDTGIPWIFPSPNMPSWETALLYPGMVLFEGVNISEGRGTTLPFHLFGAPFINPQKLMRRLERYSLEGVAFRPICFEPVFDKWKGEACYGFQVHIVDRTKIRPYRLGLILLQAIQQTHPNHFQWTPPPYEYEWEKLPIDILIGNGQVRKGLEEGRDIVELEAAWHPELAEYREFSESCFLYR